MTDRYLTLKEVLDRVPYSRTEWYRGMKDGRFPASYKRRPDKPGSRGVCWRESEIEGLLNWIHGAGSDDR